MLRHDLVAWVILPALLLAGSSANSAPLDDSTLRGAAQDKGNWLMYGRTYDDHRFSPLDQINEQTVGKLGLAWSHELGSTRGLEATPLVKDGILAGPAARSVKCRCGQGRSSGGGERSSTSPLAPSSRSTP